MNQTLFALHRWLGLLSGIFLLFIGLSGSLLTFKKPLEQWLHPALYEIHQPGNRISIDSAYSIIYSKYGSRFASCSLDIPASSTNVYEFTLEQPVENFYSRGSYVVDLHPYSGVILREGYCNEMSTSLIHWMIYFHDSFHLGKIGMFVVTLSSLIIFLSMITGILFYGKKIAGVLLFRFSLKRKSKMQVYRTIHLYIGVWALLFNIIVCFTGFWMMKSTLSPDAWKMDTQVKKMRLSISLDSCLVKSRQVLPGFLPDFISIPFAQDESVEIDGNMENSSRLMYGDASSVMFDPRNETVTGVTDIAQASFPKNFTAMFWQLHIGGYGGVVVRILYCIGGLMPGTLAVSGYILWWKRKKMYSALRR